MLIFRGHHFLQIVVISPDVPAYVSTVVAGVRVGVVGLVVLAGR